MTNPVKLKGATGGTDSASDASKWLGSGVQLLYAQPEIYPAPVPYQWFGARWLYLRGGEYTVRVASEGEASIYFNNDEPVTVPSTNRLTFVVKLGQGSNRVRIKVSNKEYKAASYIGFTITRSGSSSPEYKSATKGFNADLDDYPSAGSKPEIDKTANLPVWSIPPNWSDAVGESIEWMTNVLVSESGAEQRRKVRVLPRRKITFNITEWATSQRTLDIFVATLGKSPFILPLYFDKQATDRDIAAGSLLIDGDFSNRPDYLPGSVVVIHKAGDPLVNEALIVSSVSNGTIALKNPTIKSWPAGSILYPAVRARIEDIDSITRQTSDVATTSVSFTVIDGLDHKPAWEYVEKNDSTDMNVLTGIRNNWREATTLQMTRIVSVQDNSVSNSVVMDSGGDTSVTQRMSVMIHGREEYKKFLSLIYKLAGRYTQFQFPTRMHDIKVVKNIRHVDGHLVCEKSGYAQIKGSTQYVRQWFMITLYSGKKIFGRVISVDTDEDYDYLVLEQAVGNILLDDILMVCWCPISRLASDTVEIQHRTDLDGVAEAVLVINSFHDRRKV